MPNGKQRQPPGMQPLEPLPETPQLGTRVYQALLNSIVSGQIDPGAPLRPDVISRQLEVSTTPVREAMQRLERDGLVVKQPYQGWFVRAFAGQEIRDLYELRAALESFGARLACERIEADELAELRRRHAEGEAALAANDLTAYRHYNRDLHAAILRAARNSYLYTTMSQLALQNEMLMARTIRIVGRPLRAVEEHGRLIEYLAARDANGAETLMRAHILAALDDILRRNGPEAEQGAESKPV